MKVLKESLLLNELSGTLDVASVEPVLVMRMEKEPMVIMTLAEYNEMKAEMYKKEN